MWEQDTLAPGRGDAGAAVWVLCLQMAPSTLLRRKEKNTGKKLSAKVGLAES